MPATGNKAAFGSGFIAHAVLQVLAQELHALPFLSRQAQYRNSVFLMETRGFAGKIDFVTDHGQVVQGWKLGDEIRPDGTGVGAVRLRKEGQIDLLSIGQFKATKLTK